MGFEYVLKHLNEHHQEDLMDLCKKFDNAKEVTNVKALKVDYDGLTLVYNHNKELYLAFPAKATSETLKDVIIALVLSAKKSLDIESIQREMQEFMQGFKSVCLASLHPQGNVVCSYAPLIQAFGEYYIYISEVSEHYASIAANPKNVEVMFLEDEKEAHSAILRKRVRFKTNVVFIERGELFDRVYDVFEEQNAFNASLKTIRKMLDFHLIKLEFQEGRFVKGFGAAYDIKNGEIISLTDKNPHRHKA